MITIFVPKEGPVQNPKNHAWRLKLPADADWSYERFDPKKKRDEDDDDVLDALEEKGSKKKKKR